MQAGRECDHVARVVDNGNIARVAVMVRVIAGRDLYRTIKRRRVAGEFLSGARTKRDRSRTLIDQLAPVGGIFFREQTGVGNLDEIHVAEIFLAIRKRQLNRFNAGVNIVGAVVPHRFQVVAFQNSERE